MRRIYFWDVKERKSVRDWQAELYFGLSAANHVERQLLIFEGKPEPRYGRLCQIRTNRRQKTVDLSYGK
jgi:hypothetical protein